MDNNPDTVQEFENLLSNPQKEGLRQSLRNIPIMLRNIERAERAGIDMGTQKQELKDLEMRISKLLSEMGG